jgi:peptide-methionine (R)-S-oxide reductase
MKFEAFGPVAPYIRQNMKMGTAIMNRRSIMKYAGITGFGLAAGSSLALAFEIAKTDAEWKELLTPEQFAVLRQADTEAPNTSKLLDEHRKGVFACAGCGLPLYASDAKYDSGTGWPSFFAALPNAVGEKEDDTLFTKRTEVHCSRCGGHLGHVFNDGPEPTGLRYCMNGVALKFVPA